MKVEWVNEAKFDYYNNLEYWYKRNDSYEYPLKIIENVKLVEKEISENPYFLAVYSEKLELFRKFFFNGKFVIFYKVFEEEQRIEIRYFRSTKQKPLM
ncbi:MAG: hypothetical protein Q4A58_07965 [Fusobacterium sp.]|uniref:hypothetical protein n=1 Tax=Fusobacterium sp. TaxID=68766 RepID=UPI0026DBD9E2|nr:hypothetical protein [Fusobacterium sp.]MDO4691212.1 hypothetical protein [Fusobacterium sp.]